MGHGEGGGGTEEDEGGLEGVRNTVQIMHIMNSNGKTGYLMYLSRGTVQAASPSVHPKQPSLSPSPAQQS